MNTAKSAFSMGAALLCKLLAGLVAVKMCAYYLGVQKFGLSGQISSLVSIVTLLAGGGVTNGLTKIYADEHLDITRRLQWVNAAQILAGGSAFILLLVFIFLQDQIENRVLDGSIYSRLIFITVIFSIVPIAFSAVAQGVINGSQKSNLYAKSLVTGSVIGIFGFLLLSFCFGPRGSLCGLIWMQISQALSFLWSAYILRPQSASSYFKIPDFLQKARFLFGYGLLSISAGVTIPLVYMLVRSVVIANQGEYNLGIWQATVRLSEAYTQLPMLMISVVFFPRFAGQASAPLQWKQARDAYGFILLLMACIGIFVGVTRHARVRLLFTGEFHAVADMVFWQISGDVFRMLSYIGTSILAARGFIVFCMFAELVQASLFGSISIAFITNNVSYAPFASYLLTYFIYFCLTVFALYYFCWRTKISNALTYR